MRINKRIKSFRIFKELGWTKRETNQFINSYSKEFINQVTACKTQSEFKECIKHSYMRYVAMLSYQTLSY